MFCTLKAIAGCFQLSGIFLDISAVHSDGGIFRSYDMVESATLVNSLPSNGVPAALNATNFSIKYKMISDEVSDNPSGRLTAGYTLSFSPSLSAHVDYQYQRSNKWELENNSFTAGITWRPFAR